MNSKGSSEDPKGLISEAYKIEGITAGECRSIFMDWALSMPADCGTEGPIRTLLERHGQPDHPMTIVLQEALVPMQRPRRRGGWKSRPRD